MVKGKKSLIIAIFIIALTVLTACGKDNKAVSLIEESSQNFKSVDSLETNIIIDALFERINEFSEIKMKFELENTTNPLAGHAYGSSSFNIGGLMTGGEVEIYQVNEEDQNVSYSRVNDTWIKEPWDSQTGFYGIKSEYLEPEDNSRKFVLKEDTSIINNQECFELSGYMSGENVMNIFDITSVNDLAGIATLDYESLNKAKIPFVISIYESTTLPAKIFIDMTDVLDEMYKETDENATVSKFTVAIEYDKYNNIDPIVVPEEVKRKIK